MPLIDTRKRKSDCRPPVVDTLLLMIEYVADYENSFRKMRQKEGIAVTKERGIIFGRQEKSIPEFQKAYNMWRNKEISAQEAADMCGIHTATFYRRVQKMRKIR